MLILIGKMAASSISLNSIIFKCNVIYIRQIRVKHLESTLGYMGKFFNNGSMKLHILKVLYGLESHAKDDIVGIFICSFTLTYYFGY